MSEEEGAPLDNLASHKDLPFRLADVKINKPLPSNIPLAEPINKLRREWSFQYRLLRKEWSRDHYTTLAFGILAFCLGSVSTELWSGGDATVSGINGVLAINGFQFFQVLVSVLCWAWFTYQAWRLFPVMRVHALSLLVMWNAMLGAQIFYHRNNPNFPMAFNLSNMMEGTLIVLIVFFFLFFFWKAVVETRDLHVEVHHLHEDVRVMEAELAEHSLKGWTALFGTWAGLISISAWAGVHHIAEYGEPNYGFLLLHLLTGIPAVPALFVVLWYPQRMLGDQARVRTRAAVDAAVEMEGEPIPANATAACPDCGEKSTLTRDVTGALTHPCLGAGCAGKVAVGTDCPTCKTNMPSRLTCTSCGVNAPAIEFLPDQEAW
ncbi:MAG: hypothetical protein O3C36_04750 [archaeon]|nr:hypothetical protein [archaeon]